MLQAFNEQTGERVNVGDTVIDFRGKAGKLLSIDRAREPGRSGRVTVEGATGSYDKVFGLVVREVGE